jgi:putative YphP/YqiW family bacilliredoxin
MRYPEHLIAPMRQDLTQYGIEELRTPEDVDRLLAPGSGTVLVVVNSVCGCAAGKARPGVGMALGHSMKPQRVATVFAGGDVEATARVRELAAKYPASSPSFLLFRDGNPVHSIPRAAIEARQAPEIAQLLKQSFEQFCAANTVSE